MAATTPLRHRRRDSPETPTSQKKRLDGLWQGGRWWCNCEPRKKAALREVKRDSPNKGKFFWTCPVSPYCSFFLWRDEAVAREAGLVSAAEELPSVPKTPTYTQRPLTSFGVHVGPVRPAAESPGLRASATAGKKGLATPLSNPSKRSRDVFERGIHGSDDFSDFGSDEERQLADIADSSAEKSGRKVDAFATPTPAGPAAAADPPSPSVARTLFAGPDPKRPKTVTFDDAQPAGLPTPAKSPAKSPAAATRLGDPGAPSSSPPDADLDPVVGRVMALLKGQPVDGAVLASVAELLADSVRRARGVSLGREAARAALGEKNDQIAQLQESVATLERRERLQGSQLTNIKAQLMKMYQDN